MPTYVYRCRDCQNVFEKFQRITATPGAECPACGKEDCTRKITGGAFHLKGSGWYASDYGAPKSSQTPDEADTANSADSDSAAPADSEGGGNDSGSSESSDDTSSVSA